MLKATYARAGTAQWGADFANLTGNDIDAAIQRLLAGARGGHVADRFLSRLKAVTCAMGHTNEAAKQAKQYMFGMLTHFGLPTMMLTVTPEDGFNIRIRAAAGGHKGQEEPPDYRTATEAAIGKYAKECLRVRPTYPGLCSWDFEQVLDVTIEHLLGWDRVKKQNKKEHGLFGDIDAWSFAVEEQGRKTLHAHFLVWTTGWSELLANLHSVDKQTQATTTLCRFVDKVLTTNMHGPTETCQEVTVAGHVCTGEENVEYSATHRQTEQLVPCTLQDLRHLRYKDFDSSLGGKAYMHCPRCDRTFTSEELAALALARHLSHLGVASQWYEDGVSVERLEVLLLTAQLHEPTRQTKRSIEFVVGYLRNLHASCHRRTCFKKHGYCRMGCPCKSSERTTVSFYDDHEVTWRDWKGNATRRKMFVTEPQRSHADAFVNVHNRHASLLFGCNTNVITGCDGGAVMYMTNYQTKGTQEEDNEHFAAAARKIIHRMRITTDTGLGPDSNNNSDDNTDDVDDGNNDNDNDNNDDMDELAAQRLGLRRMIGAVFLATSAHIVAAPMAAYLTRHSSRFGYSHKFQPLYTRPFWNMRLEEASLGVDFHKNFFLSSQVSDYLHRPIELEAVCLVDFVEQYYNKTKTKGTLSLLDGHPSYQSRGIAARKEKVLVGLSYQDFVNTANFIGRDISQEPDTDMPDNAHHSMNEYARQVLTLFRPFRRMDEWKDVGDGSAEQRSHIKALQLINLETGLTERFRRMLSNIQDCRNSLNCGRVQDALERCTTKPEKEAKQPCTSCRNPDCEEEHENLSGGLETIMSEYTEAMMGVGEQHEDGMQFRNSSNQLTINQLVSRAVCTEQVRNNTLATPTFDDVVVMDGPDEEAALHHDATYDPTDIDALDDILQGQPQRTWRDVTVQELHQLTIRVVQRQLASGSGTGMATDTATGTIASINSWAEQAFGDDIDQQLAFRIIVASFVLRFYRQAIRNKTNRSSRPARRQE